MSLWLNIFKNVLTITFMLTITQLEIQTAIISNCESIDCNLNQIFQKVSNIYDLNNVLVYYNCCQFRFIKISNEGDGCLIRLSLFNNDSIDKISPSSDEKMYNVNLEQITHFFNEILNITVFVMINIQRNDSQSVRKYQIHINELREITQMGINIHKVDVLFGPFRINSLIDSFVLKKSFVSEIDDSYLLFCLSKQHFNNCEPFIIDSETPRRIQCVCQIKSTQTSKHILLLIYLLAYWIATFVLTSKAQILIQEVSEPEIQILLIMCSVKTARFQYEILFRVGNPSRFINKKTHIDIEFLSDQKEIIGNAIRYSWNRVSDPVSSQLRCLIGKILPLGRIERIKIYHSGRKNETIHLYDIQVKDMLTGEIIQECRVNKAITFEPEIIELRDTAITSNSSLRSSMPSSIIEQVEKLPDQPLTILECCVMFQFLIIYSSAVSIVFYLFPVNKFQKQSNLPIVPIMNRFLPKPMDHFFGALFVSIIISFTCGIFLGCIIYLYRCLIKRYPLIFLKTFSKR